MELLSRLDRPLLALPRSRFIADRSAHGGGNTAREPQQGPLETFLLCESLVEFLMTSYTVKIFLSVLEMELSWDVGTC